MRKVITGILLILSWIVYLAIILSVMIAMPIVLGNHPAVVLSGSMEPAYPEGSIVYYKQTDFENIDVGDVITFRIGAESLATHCVAEKNQVGRTFLTKGDANQTRDTQPVAYSNVVGKTSSFALPFAGFYTKIMQNCYIIGAMVVILLLNIFIVPEKPIEAAPTSQADKPLPKQARTPSAPNRNRRERKMTAAQYFADL